MHPERSFRSSCVAIAAMLVFLLPGACGGDEAAAGPGQPTIAFVTNGQYEFWTPAEAGVLQASRDLDVRTLFRKPQPNISDQKQVVEDLLNRGVAGLAISPIDPDNQTPFLDRVAGLIPVVTHDSDAPESERKCFVGIDNYVAGRMVGEMAAKALRDGGKVAIFIGNLSQDNARHRRQGVLDVLLGREERSSGFDPTGDPIEGNGFTIVGTYTDDGDRVKAKANAEDVLNRHPDTAGMIGLFAYNPPSCLEALRAQRRLGEVALIGFDEDEATLSGIEEGHVAGTVVQNPYEYGYRAVTVLTALVRGEEDAVPEDGLLTVRARKIDRDNLAEFRAGLQRQLAILENK